MKRVYWWKHNCPMGQYSAAQVHRTLDITLLPECDVPRCYEDYDSKNHDLPGLVPEIMTGR